jgi:NAD(P)-dependent dehydrogenase (short-subunit alcohol dehydrogenase family)
MQINARGVFLCYQYAAAQMVKQGRGGRILGANAIGGKIGQSITPIVNFNPG